MCSIYGCENPPENGKKTCPSCLKFRRSQYQAYGKPAGKRARILKICEENIELDIARQIKGIMQE